MLKNILDFKAVNCIRDRVFEGYRESGNIIFNKNSKISKDIKEYEDELNKSTAEFYPIAVNGLKYYRSDKKELLVSLIKNSVQYPHQFIVLSLDRPLSIARSVPQLYSIHF
jgi:hypothetical protein